MNFGILYFPIKTDITYYAWAFTVSASDRIIQKMSNAKFVTMIIGINFIFVDFIDA